MFDIAFSELVVIGVVALIVIGPEKLPKVARTVGLLLGRVQRYVNGVKSDISRELRFEELQRLQQEVQQGIRQAESTIHQTGHDLEHEMQQLASVAPSPEQAVAPEPIKSEPSQLEALEPVPAQPAAPAPQQSTLDLSFDSARQTDHAELQPETPQPQASPALNVEHAQAVAPIPSKQDKPD